MRITQKAIAAGNFDLPFGKTDALLFDDEIAGFGLRVRKGGSRKWIFQWEVKGKTKRVTFGSYPAITVEKARATAAEMYAKVKLGRDPSQEKEDGKTRAIETLKASIDLYLEQQKAKLRPRSLKEVERHLLVHAKPLHPLPLANIERRKISDLLNVIEEASGPVAANRVRSSLSAFFAWCVREGLVDSNPVADTNKRGEKSRSRVLSDSELREIWAALSADAYSDIVRLLLLTAQRRSEIGGLTYSEIDMTSGEIQLGADRMKNRQEHLVPLTAPAKAIIKRWLPDKPAENETLPAALFADSEHGFTNWSKSKRELDQRITDARRKATTKVNLKNVRGMENWTLHDLRRTTSTVMADRLKIQPHIIEAVLAHTGHKSGIHGIYNKASYLLEKRDALAKWNDYLFAEIITRSTRKSVDD